MDTMLEQDSRQAIVAGLFDDQAAADRAATELRTRGVADADIDVFALNRPGMHHGLPLGGDEDADRSAASGDTGALKGAALGSAIGIAAGLVATPLVGPAGLVAGMGAGAFVGSLAGATQAMGDQGHERTIRSAGIMVTTPLRSLDQQAVTEVFRNHGAKLVEAAQGRWQGGHWVDFDPVAPPQRVLHVVGNPQYPT